MASPRTDKIYGYLKADGTYVWFRFAVDDAGNYQFIFQTGTSVGDQNLVAALPYFQPNYGYPGATKTTGAVIDPSLVPGGGGFAPVGVPANSASAGTANSVSWDDGYFYLCIATNTWRRAVIMDWA